LPATPKFLANIKNPSSKPSLKLKAVVKKPHMTCFCLTIPDPSEEWTLEKMTNDKKKEITEEFLSKHFQNS
jgi:hypothetical protein